MGSLLDTAIEDMRAFISDDEGFSIPMTITPTEGDPFEIKGLAFVISEGFDEDGLPIVADNSHILISEKDIVDLGYTVRFSGNVRINSWIIDFDHAVGHVRAKLSEPKPDSTLGVIKVQLTNYHE